MDIETELIASQQSAAAGDADEAQRHWSEFVRLLFLKMRADGLPVAWMKNGK